MTAEDAQVNTWTMLMRQELRASSTLSMRTALDALDWVRKEIVRLKAPDQFRLGIREQSVQRLCAKLLRRGELLGRNSRPRVAH